MHCSTCGAPTFKDSRFCHKCGSVISAEPEPSNASEGEQEQREQRLIDELLSKNRKQHECHQCGTKGKLFAWDFGLAKPIGSKRVWARTAASVALSAITLPLLGVGRLDLPGKKTSLGVLRLRLLLCEECKRGRINYTIHPCWNDALRLGYTEFLTADDLNKLRPIRP